MKQKIMHPSLHLLFKCLFVTLTVGGCSLLNTNRLNRNTSAPEVRDVPFEARETRDTTPRKRVIILPFVDNGTARSDKAALYAREAFIRSLRKTDEFVIVAPSELSKDPSSFLKGGEYDLESMAKLGGAMGLSAIIEGRVLEVKAHRIGDEVGLVRQVRARIHATVQVRVVNTKNSHIILNETRSADIEDTTTRVAEHSSSDRFLEEDPQLIDNVVTQAFKGLIPKIAQSVEKLNWEGRVAMVKGDRIFLNAGRISGLQIGDILKVMEEGEDVYDPDSGGLIGRVPGRLKGTLEVVSYFGKDGSIGIVHSGSGFRDNDLVELY
jgi:hypothetical protein